MSENYHRIISGNYEWELWVGIIVWELWPSTEKLRFIGILAYPKKSNVIIWLILIPNLPNPVFFPLLYHMILHPQTNHLMCMCIEWVQIWYLLITFLCLSINYSLIIFFLFLFMNSLIARVFLFYFSQLYKYYTSKYLSWHFC